MLVAGSYALQDAVLPEDSTVAAKLREKGLVILSKASLSEWAMARSDNSSHAWNAVSGQTYGAYYPDQCPSGSSGGSAVATDLGLAWATLGTEVCFDKYSRVSSLGYDISFLRFLLNRSEIVILTGYSDIWQYRGS